MSRFMDIHIHLEKKHAYAFVAAVVLLLGGLFVTAFGGSTPSVLGHSALELLVNGSSISSNNITDAHINEATLAGAPCAVITGSAALCDGADANSGGTITGGGATDQLAFFSSSSALTSSSIFRIDAGTVSLTIDGGNLVVFDDALESGGTDRLEVAGNIRIKTTTAADRDIRLSRSVGSSGNSCTTTCGTVDQCLGAWELSTGASLGCGTAAAGTPLCLCSSQVV